MNPIAIRLLNQQLIAPQFSNPAEVVSFMGAMQAQEYHMMRWAESCCKYSKFTANARNKLEINPCQFSPKAF